eukprot:TRINITY_DN10771_c0_g1_i1.p1 TRINITY_DN10771_c0_g1~~TRINITY_DN10771_c0_g1_i1.p1  ORF type:complete len:607 (+),score=164.59 TRINITY_DN10771_c0_g1_i1:181-2001(+)
MQPGYPGPYGTPVYGGIPPYGMHPMMMNPYGYPMPGPMMYPHMNVPPVGTPAGVAAPDPNANLAANNSENMPKKTSGSLYKVYVGQIAPSVEDGFLLKLLECCGPVIKWKRMEDPINGQLKAFGICKYDHPQSISHALALLHDLKLDQRALLLRIDPKTQSIVVAWEAQRKKEELEEAQQQLEMKETQLREQPPDPDLTTDKNVTTDPNEDGNDNETADKPEDDNETEQKDAKPKLLSRAEAEANVKRLMQTRVPVATTSSHANPSDNRDHSKEFKDNFSTSQINQQRGINDDFTRMREDEYRRLVDKEISRERREKERERALIRDNRKREREREVRRRERELRDYREMAKAWEAHERRVAHKRESNERKRKRSRVRMEDRELDYSSEEDRQYRYNGRRRKYSLREEYDDEEDRRREAEEQRKSSREKRQSKEGSNTKTSETDKAPAGIVGFELSKRRTKLVVATGFKPIEKAGKKPKPKKLIKFEPLKSTEELLREQKEEAKKLIATIPLQKEELFVYVIDWEIVEAKNILQGKIRKFLEKKMKEEVGDDAEMLIESILEQLQKRSSPQQILEEVSFVLEDAAEKFVLLLWRRLIFEILKEKSKK